MLAIHSFISLISLRADFKGTKGDPIIVNALDQYRTAVEIARVICCIYGGARLFLAIVQALKYMRKVLV